MALIIRRAFLVEELVWYFAQCWPHRIISSATLSDMAKEWTRTCAAAAAAAAAADDDAAAGPVSHVLQQVVQIRK